MRMKRPTLVVEDGPRFYTERGAWAYSGLSDPRWVEKLRTIDPMKFMTKREREIFARLPEEFTVYRAEEPDKPRTFSF